MRSWSWRFSTRSRSASVISASSPRITQSAAAAAASPIRPASLEVPLLLLPKMPYSARISDGDGMRSPAFTAIRSVSRQPISRQSRSSSIAEWRWAVSIRSGSRRNLPRLQVAHAPDASHGHRLIVCQIGRPAPP